jgi:hypothetical protein
MKSFLKLYPRSWQERYGDEMELLLDESPGGLGVALDLLLGAATAYAIVIRGNRILSAAGAYLHGVCVAVLVQAIAFVTLILVAQRSFATTEVAVGPFRFALVIMYSGLFGLRQESASLLMLRVVGELPAFILLTFLLAVLALVIATPRLLRTLR